MRFKLLMAATLFAAFVLGYATAHRSDSTRPSSTAVLQLREIGGRQYVIATTSSGAVAIAPYIPTR